MPAISLARTAADETSILDDLRAATSSAEVGVKRKRQTAMEGSVDNSATLSNIAGGGVSVDNNATLSNIAGGTGLSNVAGGATLSNIAGGTGSLNSSATGLCTTGLACAHQGGGRRGGGWLRLLIWAKSFPGCLKSFEDWIELEGEEKAKKIFWSLAAGKLEGNPFGGEVWGFRNRLDLWLKERGLDAERKSGDRLAEINFQRVRAAGR